MAQSTTKLKSFFQDTYSQAQNRIVELAERAQTSIKTGSTKSKERLEGLTAQLQLKELVDKLTNIEALKPGYLKDLGSQFGLITKEELKGIHKELAALKKEVAELKKKLAKKSTSKSSPRSKATAKPSAKATSKASSRKASKTGSATKKTAKSA